MTKKIENCDNFRIAVPTDFKNVFSHFYSAENKSNEIITKTLLPSYQTILVFSFGTKALLYSKQGIQIEINKCLVLGPIKKAFDYSLPPQTKILVANFKGDAFYRFFGKVLLTKQLLINPDELLYENCFATLWNELNKIRNSKQQVDYILKFCKPYLRDRDTIAEQLSNFKDQSLNPIKAVAERNNQTVRNIQLIHKKNFGYSDKEIHRYQRFMKAIEIIESIAIKSFKIDWFSIINNCGYYDQSQLINDFKHYLNLTPTKYLKFQQDICNPAS